jgi:type I restriction enzyme S subunit
MTNKTTVELLNDHFDIALETPDGVKKLRELILSLIMQEKKV